MALESATYIGQLVPTNPVGATDQKAQGDDHIRMMKAAVQATFPGMVGRAWRTQTKVANYTLTSDDNMTVIEAGASFTLSALAASAIGNGFVVVVHTNSHTVTFDPNAAEQVNGASSVTIFPEQIATLLCAGSFWHATLAQRNGGVPPGTRMLFQQTVAPAGWTKEGDTAYQDAAVRFTTGTAGIGGTNALSTLGAGLSADGMTLTTAHLPASGLSFSGSISGSAADHAHIERAVSGIFDPNPVEMRLNSGLGGAPNRHTIVYTEVSNGNLAGNLTTANSGSLGLSGSCSGNTSNMGSGQSHSHSLSSFAMKYADVIVATKQ